MSTRIWRRMRLFLFLLIPACFALAGIVELLDRFFMWFGS